MQPFLNTMALDFGFRPDAAAVCGTGPETNLAGAILKDSYLDLTGIPHGVALPNLQLFAAAGYPFTRLADIADTVVVVPDQPTPAEMELLFALMAHFGEATGYPALRVTVANPAEIRTEASKNYVLLGTVADLARWGSLADKMPVTWGMDGLSTQRADSPTYLRWLHPSGAHGVYEGLAGDDTAPDAIIEEFEWPQGSRRTALAIVIRDDSSAATLASALAGGSGLSGGDVAALRGPRLVSYRVAGGSYRIAEDSALMRMSSTLKVFPWLVAILTVFFCFLIAVLVQAMLRRSARLRLRGVE
jgi:cellulose synthase (UDP-forming)